VLPNAVFAKHRAVVYNTAAKPALLAFLAKQNKIHSEDMAECSES